MCHHARSPLGALLIAGLVWTAPITGRAAASADLWQEAGSAALNRPGHERLVRSPKFRAFQLQHAPLRGLLNRAPRERSRSVAASDAVISLPQPDGTQARFRFVESPVMPDELAARFPEIKTYVGRGVDDPTATVRFDLTPAGFHAQILSPNGATYIEPCLRGDTSLHAVYARRDSQPASTDFQCLTASAATVSASSTMTESALVAGSLRTYRLACAATAEYTAYFGGTVSAGLSAVVTAINRVTGIYESELGIRLMLVADNDKIIYTNSGNQPYSNGNPSALLSQNQGNLDTVIGSGNYDVGHVFSTGGGGLAAVGVVCVGGLKAQGETGTYPPVGDAFYIDYVAHEIGHQFGASHTFNSSLNGCGFGNRCAESAYEPGSGSTIMSYAGICSADNLQSHSGAYFHSRSLEQILAYVTGGAASEATTLSGSHNSPPTVTAGATCTLPIPCMRPRSG